MPRTFEDIRKLLAQKFQVESHRLKSWGTPTDEKSAISFADSVARYVQALMADSRYRELKRVLKKVPNDHYAGNRGLRSYIEERIRATKAMATAIQHAAEEAESKKAWKPKSVKKEKQHHHHEHDRKHKHDKCKKSKHRSRH